jgi:hypothetical protein
MYKWMDKTACSFAFLSPCCILAVSHCYRFLESPHACAPVLLCSCALHSTTTESIDRCTSLFSKKEEKKEEKGCEEKKAGGCGSWREEGKKEQGAGWSLAPASFFTALRFAARLPDLIG